MCVDSCGFNRNYITRNSCCWSNFGALWDLMTMESTRAYSRRSAWKFGFLVYILFTWNLKQFWVVRVNLLLGIPWFLEMMVMMMVTVMVMVMLLLLLLLLLLMMMMMMMMKVILKSKRDFCSTMWPGNTLERERLCMQPNWIFFPTSWSRRVLNSKVLSA